MSLQGTKTDRKEPKRLKGHKRVTAIYKQQEPQVGRTVWHEMLHQLHDMPVEALTLLLVRCGSAPAANRWPWRISKTRCTVFGKSAMAPQKAEGRLQHFSAWLSTISYNFGLSMELDSCHVRRSRSIMAGVNLSFHGSPNTALENSLVRSLSLSLSLYYLHQFPNASQHHDIPPATAVVAEARPGGQSGGSKR